MNELLTTKEAAARLGCDISTVRRMIRNLELRATRYGSRTYLIAARDLARVERRPVGRPKKETKMAQFEHEVSEDLQKRSRWDEDYACYVTPDGRRWRYTDDPEGTGSSWRDGQGQPISLAVWIKE